MKFVVKHKYKIVMVVAVLIILWPLSSYMYIPRWDNLDGFLPYRYFNSDYVWNGYFPYWNSFQMMGYPAYADPQSGMWNPITWIINLFGKYTVGSLISEMLVYYILAALGMFWLIKSLYQNELIAAIIGFVYALSGPMIGTAQLMVFTSGTAYLPWCIASMFLFSKTFQWKYIVLSGLFVALHVVVASPSFTVLLIYIYFFVYVYLFYLFRKNKNKLLKIFLSGFLLIAVSIALLLPYIASFLDFAPYFLRIEKLSYEKATINPLNPINLISFILPYVVLSDSTMLYPTDISTRSIYIGLLPFAFAIYSIIKYRKNRKIQLLTGLSLFFIIASFGSFTPLYKILYQLPGFGVFRHPSFLKVYAVFLLLIIAGYGLREYMKSFKQEKIKLHWKAIIIIFTIILLAFLLFKNDLIHLLKKIQILIKGDAGMGMAFSKHLFINSIVLFILFIFLILINKVFKYPKSVSIVLFVLLDFAIITPLYAYQTIIFNLPFKEYKQYFKDLPDEISQEKLDMPLHYFSEKQDEIKKITVLWGNISTYHKVISAKGYNPFRSKQFNEASLNGDLEFNTNNPLFFFAAKERKNRHEKHNSNLVWGKYNFDNLDIKNTKIINSRIGFNSFFAEVENNSNKPQLLLLNQNFNHHWKANIDGKEIPVMLMNTHIMAVEIPANSKPIVQFYYSYKNIYYFIVGSIIASILIGVYLLRYFILTPRKYF